MPLLTLTSDIGQQDFLIGAVKGQLLQANPSFSLVDITHNLSPFNYPQSAYVCRNAIKNFPPGSFHLILVNLFDEKPEHLLLAEHNGHFIGCADNGLLTMILEEVPQKTVALALDKQTSSQRSVIQILKKSRVAAQKMTKNGHNFLNLHPNFSKVGSLCRFHRVLS